MKEGNTITLTAVGDIMLGGGVEALIKQYGAEYPFQHVATILKNSDITFANLESPLTNENNKAVWDYTKILGKPIEIDGKVFSSVYCKAPPDAVKGLTYAGFDILSLANNHIMDYGATGLFDTIKALSESNIKFVGAGKNINDARKPVILQVKDVEVGFLAYSDVYIASKKRPGVAPTKYIEKDIEKLKDEVDVVVISIHQGMDIVDYPLSNEVQMMHSIIDSGADLILRHHPHVAQGIEHYKNGVIVYSLGNFVFDYTIDPLWKDFTKARESMIFRCELSKDGIVETEIVPVVINNHFQPEIPSADDKNRIMTRIEKLSSNITNNNDSGLKEKIQNDYVRTEMALAYHVMVSSIKKRKFRNILLMLDRIELYHIRLFMIYLVKRILFIKNKKEGDDR